MKAKLDKCIADKKIEIMLFGLEGYQIGEPMDYEEFRDSTFKLSFEHKLDVVYLNIRRKARWCISIHDLYNCFVPASFGARIIFFLQSIRG